MPDTTSELDYPDILGMITGGPRLNVEVVQCAFGVHPHAAAVGQPFEALVLLQNACDKPAQVTVTVRLPRKDATGNRINISTPKEVIPINLEASEMGLLHIPVVTSEPTQPSPDNLLGVQIGVKGPRRYKTVRPAFGGRAASMLNMSPFRLEILREVGFTANVRDQNMLVDLFNVIPGSVNPAPMPAAPRYETLWMAKELPKEQARYAEMTEQAKRFANTLSRNLVMEPLTVTTENVFARAGLPLHPGESIHIAKTLTYVMEDGLEIEPGFKLIEGRWFRMLASVMDDKSITGDIDRLIAYLYPGVVHDAVRVGLVLVETHARERLGTRQEHIAYADEVIASLTNPNGTDLGHAYLPLILAGIVLTWRVKGVKENPWTSCAEIREAWQGRKSLGGAPYEWVDRVLNMFLDQSEKYLADIRVPRP